MMRWMFEEQIGLIHISMVVLFGSILLLVAIDVAGFAFVELALIPLTVSGLLLPPSWLAYYAWTYLKESLDHDVVDVDRDGLWLRGEIVVRSHAIITGVCAAIAGIAWSAVSRSAMPSTTSWVVAIIGIVVSSIWASITYVLWRYYHPATHDQWQWTTRLTRELSPTSVLLAFMVSVLNAIALTFGGAVAYLLLEPSARIALAGTFFNFAYIFLPASLVLSLPLEIRHAIRGGSRKIRSHVEGVLSLGVALGVLLMTIPSPSKIQIAIVIGAAAVGVLRIISGVRNP